jgi:hypothetical protein
LRPKTRLLDFNFSFTEEQGFWNILIGLVKRVDTLVAILKLTTGKTMRELSMVGRRRRDSQLESANRVLRARREEKHK